MKGIEFGLLHDEPVCPWCEHISLSDEQDQRCENCGKRFECFEQDESFYTFKVHKTSWYKIGEWL